MKKRKIISLLCTLVLGTTLIATGCSKGSKETSTEKDKDYTVNLGYYNCDHMTSACVAKDAGIFDKMGLKVNVSGNGKVPQAMAAGKMDVGYIGYAGLIRGLAKGSPITVAANNHLGGSMYLVVSNKIKDPKDLKGKKLGIGTKPEESETWLMCAKKLGIPTEGKNYDCVEFGSDKDAYLALKAGKIDGFTCCDPWGSMAEYEKTGHIIATADKIVGEDKWGECCVYSMNIKFEKEHPELAKKMIQAHVEAMKYCYEHPIKAAKIFAKNYQVPEEVAIMTIYKKTVGEGRTITWKMNDDYFKTEIDTLMKYKLIEEDPDYDKLISKKVYEEAKVDDFDKFIKENVDSVFPVGMKYEEWKVKAMEIDK